MISKSTGVSESEDSAPLHVISLGAGVQSSTMAMMAAHGEITPMPSFAVFADTGDEPDEVYEWLEKLKKLLPFPVVTAHRRIRSPGAIPALRDHIVEYNHTQIPCFVERKGRAALGKRQCTKHWKIMPIMRAIREQLGTVGKPMKKGSVCQWIGISLDEAHRMKPSRNKWQVHRFPLIDKRMRRRDCITWLREHGHKSPPKSACVYCPYQERARWRKAKEEDGRSWAIIVKVDQILRHRGEFLTKDLKRIDEIDFSTADERSGQESLFGNECEGMCGV